MSLPLLETRRISKFGLFAIFVFLMIIHLSLTWRSSEGNTIISRLLSISIPFWGFTLFLLYKKHRTLNLQSTIYSKILGVLILSFVLYKRIPLFVFGHLHFNYIPTFLYIAPFISALGLGIFASGIKGLKQYWQELVILFTLAVPLRTIILQIIDLATLTAKFSTYLLSFLGFDVYRQGVHIILPTGSVKVIVDCAGISSIVLLLQLSVLIFINFPFHWIRKVLVIVIAICVPWVINIGRVALMAVLVASDNEQAFNYWHEGGGSKIIYTICLLIFGLCCLFLTKEDESKNQDIENSTTI